MTITGTRKLAVAAAALATTALLTTACGENGTAVPETTPTTSTSAAAPDSGSGAPSDPAAAPTGAPVGTAIIEVTGGTGPVTLTYSINGADERTETVTLPWTTTYDVYDQVETSVSVDSGGATAACTITLTTAQVTGGLVTFKNEPNPTCSYAHWG